MRRRTVFVLSTLTLIAVACGGRREAESGVFQKTASDRMQAPGALAAGSARAEELAVASRKIIRNVDLGLAVADADAFLKAVESLVGKSGGYVADRQVSHNGSSVVGGSLVLRIPAERLDGTSESLRALGSVDSESMRAEDISEQYADLAARLTNARHFETRLLKMLEEKAGSLADVIALESKLSEVRREIEQLEGRQRLWDHQVSLATVRLSFRVATTVVERSLPHELVSAFTESGTLLGTFLMRVTFFLVALLPWSPLLIGIGFVVRRWQRKSVPAMR